MSPQERQPEFSLVLGTYGRTREVERFLASLSCQAYRGFELILIDQNQDEKLTPILRSYSDQFTIVHVQMKERGISKARNVGLGRVSKDIIAFPDDDCQYPPDLLYRVAQYFVDFPESDGLTGRSTDESGTVSMGRFDSRFGSVDRFNVWRRAVEYTIFLRREKIRGVWFDEALGPGAGTIYGAGEGTEYLLQLLASESRLHYNPDLVVIHPSPHHIYGATVMRDRAYRYGCGAGHVLRQGRYPLWFMANWLIRPLGGAILSLGPLRFSEARYRWNTFRGRLRGMLS